jgi:hypothetical protein
MVEKGSGSTFRSRGRRNIIHSRMECPNCHQRITTGVSASIRPDGMIGLSWRDQQTSQWCVVAFHVDEVVTGTEPRTELWKRFWHNRAANAGDDR